MFTIKLQQQDYILSCAYIRAMFESEKQHAIYTVKGKWPQVVKFNFL